MRIVLIVLLAGCSLLAACGKTRGEVKSAAVTQRIEEGATIKDVHFAPVGPAQAKELTSYLVGWDSDQYNDMAGSWMEAAEIVFTLDDNSKIKVSVSWDFKDWSSGHGDLAVKPGLKNYIETKLAKE